MGEDTTLADRGSLRSQRMVLYRILGADHRSLLTRAVPFLLELPGLLLEHLSTLRVVAEHVEAGARRRQEHGAARGSQREGLPDRAAHVGGLLNADPRSERPRNQA